MQKNFTQFLLLCFVIITMAGAAQAAEFPKDGAPIATGTVYDVKMFEDYQATITPTTSGTLLQDGCPALKVDGLTDTFIGFGGKYGQVYAYQVEAGKTYTISTHGFVMDNGSVCFTMEADTGVQISTILPIPGQVLSPIANLSGDVQLLCNTSVLIESAYLCAGNDQISLTNVSILANTIVLDIKNAMCTLYANGTLSREGGESVKIEINGLQSTSGTRYNGDGHLTLNYVASPQLTDMVSNNVPNVLKSYYPKGDTEGIWTFVFDRNIINDGSVWLSINCGNPQNEGTYYDEKLYPQIDGATLTFDLTDKVRDLSDYLMYQGSNYVGIKLNNVRDTAGNLAIGSGQGNVGSYSYSPSFNYLQPENLVCEFDPPTGTSLKGVDEIEIWFNKANMIEWEGVEFNYHTDSGYESAIVLKSGLKYSLENNEVTINVAVPDIVKGHDQVTVSLYNMQSIDGNQYNIQAYYDMFVVDLLSPIHDGEAITSTGNDDFVFNINLTNNYFYLRYDFYNAEGPDGWVYGSQLHQQSDGTWTAANGDFVCYKDFNPYMVVSAYYLEDDYNYGFHGPAETFTFTFVGTTEPFSFSDVKFVSIDPEPNEFITPSEDFCFTIIYDGLVNIDTKASGIMLGMGMGVAPFERVEPIYDGEDYEAGYSNTWRLYPSIDIMETMTSLDISIFAKDQNGKVVEGNLGAGEYDCMQFSYPIRSEANFLDLFVSPENFSVVDRLNEFTFSYPGMDVSINYSYLDNAYPRLFNSNFELIKEFRQDDFIMVNTGDNTVLKVKFADITEAGNYSLSVPENFMLIGDLFDVHGNAFYWGDYTVSGSSGSIDSVISIDSDIKVYNLQGIRVDAAKLRPGLYIIDGKKVVITK